MKRALIVVSAIAIVSLMATVGLVSMNAKAAIQPMTGGGWHTSTIPTGYWVEGSAIYGPGGMPGFEVDTNHSTGWKPGAYEFMAGLAVMYVPGTAYSIKVKGNFSQWDTFTPDLAPGRRYVNVYLLDSTGHNIVQTIQVLDCRDAKGVWYGRSVLFYGLTPGTYYKIAIGRGAGWQTDWSLTASWNDVIVTSPIKGTTVWYSHGSPNYVLIQQPPSGLTHWTQIQFHCDPHVMVNGWSVPMWASNLCNVVVDSSGHKPTGQPLISIVDRDDISYTWGQGTDFLIDGTRSYRVWSVIVTGYSYPYKIDFTTPGAVVPLPNSEQIPGGSGTVYLGGFYFGRFPSVQPLGLMLPYPQVTSYKASDFWKMLRNADGTPYTGIGVLQFFNTTSQLWDGLLVSAPGVFVGDFVVMKLYQDANRVIQQQTTNYGSEWTGVEYYSLTSTAYIFDY
jgi:hypothetical protein